MAYQRVLLKLSGEALGDPRNGQGFDPAAVQLRPQTVSYSSLDGTQVLGQPYDQIEIAMVDRAHADRHAQCLALDLRLAEAGHAVYRAHSRNCRS